MASHSLSGDGMSQPQAHGVQELVVQRTYCVPKRLRKLSARLVGGLGIHGVTDERMSKVREVHPYLMGPPGLKLASDPGHPALAAGDLEAKTLDHLPVRDRSLAPVDDSVALSIFGVPGEWLIDGAAVYLGVPPTQGTVLPVHGVLRKLSRESLVGLLRSGHTHHPAGALVQSMHNPWTLGMPAVRIELVEDRIHQRAVGVSLRGMNHEPRRLVHNDERVVFKQDVVEGYLALYRQHRG